MSHLDHHRQVLQELLELMQRELDAIEAGDLGRIHEATQRKLELVEHVRRIEEPGTDPELAALVTECAALNARAALRVNLLLARTDRRLGALAQVTGQGQAMSYGANGRLRRSGRPGILASA